MQNLRNLTALCAVLLALPVLPAADSTAPVTVIHAGRLLDHAARPARGPSTLIVRDGRISEVLDGHVAPPAGATLVNLADRFVLPGLIDCHVHLETDAGGDAVLVERVTSSPATIAYRAAANARKTLLAGFTTVRNLGDSSGATLALRDAIAAGELPGPRILDAGRSISTTAGHMDAANGMAEDLHPSLEQDNLVDGVESARRAVRLQIRRGVDVIKIATTGGVNSRTGSGLAKQVFEDEAKALVETAHLYKKKIAVHAHGNDGINIALAAGADSIEHGTIFDDETLRLFKQTGAYYVPTLSTVNGYLERLAANPKAYPPVVLAKVQWRIQITGESLRKAYPAGVKIAFGTDAGVSKHGRNADEFELMVKHGMPPAAAIAAATINAATLLGVEADAGTLEPGKAADIIAVKGDPLTDVTVLKQVGFVMKGGVVAKHVQ